MVGIEVPTVPDKPVPLLTDDDLAALHQGVRRQPEVPTAATRQ